MSQEIRWGIIVLLALAWATVACGDTNKALRLQAPRLLEPAFKPFSADEAEAFRRLWDLPGATEANRPAESAVPVAHQRTLYRGRVWSVTTFHSIDGLRCAGLRIPGEGQEVGCFPLAARSEPIVTGGQARVGGFRGKTIFEIAWIWGITSAANAVIEVVTADCARRTVIADRDGVFLVLFPDPSDNPPVAALRRGSDGHVIWRESVKVDPTQMTPECPSLERLW